MLERSRPLCSWSIKEIALHMMDYVNMDTWNPSKKKKTHGAKFNGTSKFEKKVGLMIYEVYIRYSLKV